MKQVVWLPINFVSKSDSSSNVRNLIAAAWLKHEIFPSQKIDDYLVKAWYFVFGLKYNIPKAYDIS